MTETKIGQAKSREQRETRVAASKKLIATRVKVVSPAHPYGEAHGALHRLRHAYLGKDAPPQMPSRIARREWFPNRKPSRIEVEGDAVLDARRSAPGSDGLRLVASTTNQSDMKPPMRETQAGPSCRAFVCLVRKWSPLRASAINLRIVPRPLTFN